MNKAYTPAPCTSEQELLERYGAAAFMRQLDFADAVGTLDWNVDMRKGEIAFGGELVFPLQVIGTFAYNDETWLWAWANEKSGIAPALQEQALQLKAYGEQHAIDLLRQPTFDASKNDLYLIGLIAAGMFDASGYYLADYGPGVLVATVTDAKLEPADRNEHLEILTRLPQFFSQYEVNHRKAFSDLVRSKGYTLDENGLHLSAVKGSHTITASFDEASRLLQMKG